MKVYNQYDRQDRQPFSARQLRVHPRYESDSSLWNSFREGNNEALSIIFDRFSGVLYKYGCKIINDGEVVKDNIQDLFVQLYKNRASIGETNTIKLYLFKALRRRIFRVRSKERSLKILLSSYYEGTDMLSESPEYDLILDELSDEQKQIVKSLMGKLTVRQHEAIFLRYYEELDYDTVASIMGIRKRAVYNLVHEAIELLRNYIKKR